MKRNAILSAAVLFFLGMQCYGIYFMQYRHPGPIGLDDAATYIANIAFVSSHPFSPGSIPDGDQMVFSLLYGHLSHFLGVSPEVMFHANFYVGMFLMAGTLLLFFSRIDRSPLFVATAFALFAFYEGKGSYHGFFWVVPSFYAVMFFLLTVVTLFHSRHRILFSAPLVMLLLFTHSLGLYLLAILAGSLVLVELFEGRVGRAFYAGLIPLVIGSVLVVAGEYLHGNGLFPFSFLSALRNYQSADLRLLMAGGEGNPWQYVLGGFFRDFFGALSRHDFARYFYGLYTPLLVYGLHQAVKDQKHVLLSLFIVALLGQIAAPLFSEFAYRFFYILEILSWTVIAYGISALPRLVRGSGMERNRRYSGWALFLFFSLSPLSVLFLYNALYHKVSHNWDVRLSRPWYFDERPFLEYVHAHKDRAFAVYAANKGIYLGLGAASQDAARLVFSPPADEINANPEKWLVVGESPRYYSASRNGFKAYFPSGAVLRLRFSLSPGRYVLELKDTGLSSPESLSVNLNGKGYAEWASRYYEVLSPEDALMPPILLPWYRYGTKPWPLQARPISAYGVVRSAMTHGVPFETGTSVEEISVLNKGAGVYLTGEISVRNLDTGSTKRIDLFWGDAAELDEALSLMHRGSVLPLLWTDPDDASCGRYLFRLEKSFRDVKIFACVMPRPR